MNLKWIPEEEEGVGIYSLTKDGNLIGTVARTSLERWFAAQYFDITRPIPVGNYATLKEAKDALINRISEGGKNEIG